MEPITRPRDYECQTFSELTELFQGILLKSLSSSIPVDLVALLTKYVIWEGPKLRDMVDVYWPTDKQFYRAIIVSIGGVSGHCQVRYIGWHNRWNEWVDINLNEFDTEHDTDGDMVSPQTGRVFPLGYHTHLTRVGLSMCWRSDATRNQTRTTCVALRKDLGFEEGAWVVQRDLESYNYLSQITKTNHCDKFIVEIDRGGRRLEWVFVKTLLALRTPPIEWSCHCDAVAVMRGRLWCGVCGAMWMGL